MNCPDNEHGVIKGCVCVCVLEVEVTRQVCVQGSAYEVVCACVFE